MLSRKVGFGFIKKLLFGHQNQINKKVLARLWRKGNPSALLVGMQADVATVEKSMETAF